MQVFVSRDGFGGKIIVVMGNAKAIVTLTIGDRYESRWKQLCEPGWKKYADDYGYDLYCLNTPLDDSERAQRRSPAWQKCLILSQDFAQQYEQVVWMDSDIFINTLAAPCVVAEVPVNKVGGVDAWSWPTAEIAQTVLARMYDYWGDTCTVIDRTPQEYYVSYGLPPAFDQVVQTGVLVLSPQHHRHLLERVYYEYEETGKGNFEMRPLSYELLRAGVMHWLDHRYNLIWFAYKALHYPFLFNKALPVAGREPQPERKLLSFLKRGALDEQKESPRRLRELCATTAFINSFFLHFAGADSEMSLVDLNATSWRDLK